MQNLKKILLINGVSTAFAGLILLAIPEKVSGWFGISTAMYFLAVGIFFTLFGVFVFYQAISKHVSKSSLVFITIVDWLWVIISIALIVSLQATITSSGLAIIIAIAAWVALMAFLEGRHL
ncbi:MAG TPA: hypothetical protein PKE30_15625 [Niabella sp.]|nr:hypothetical protein [Niabella sp.]